MIAKLITFVAILAVSTAIPMWIGNPYSSGLYFRHAQPPSIAFGFGSGFSSDIGGIKHSSSYGNSFQTGNAQAYGAGFGSSDGNTFARGVGYAQTAPHQNMHQFQFRHPVPQGFQQATAATFSSGGRSFGSASAQSFGNFGSAISSAQSIDGIGSAVSAVQNNGHDSQSISSVQNLGRNGYDTTIASTNNNGHGGSAISRADNFGGYKTAISSTQGHNNFNNYGQGAIAQNVGGYRTSNAYNVQQGGSVQNSVAINGPGIQVAQTYSNNNGLY